MCGIAGFLGNFNPNILPKMASAMAHRGPDGEGTWSDEKAQIGLAHRRLSILDLSDNAKQPMSGVGERYQLSYNGEIYNFKEIYETLKGNYKLNAQSDTSVIAPLYDAYGSEMFEEINGMFAFALWDKEAGILTLARDHMGVKPLYYMNNSDGFVFASELKTLLAAVPNLDKTLDTQAVKDYATYLWSPGEKTMFTAVKKLMPGHFLQAKMGKNGAVSTAIKCYYTPPLTGKTESLTPQNLQDKLFQTIEKQCVSDVPIGAFLSGGVDSSAVVAGMVAAGIQPKNTYCVKFSGKDAQNEGFSADVLYARQVAKHLNVSLTEIESDASLLDKLPNLINILEEPLADPAPLYVQQISKAAHGDGIKVLMSGTGGDDVFAGYRRHQAAVLRQRLGFLAKPMGHGLSLGKFAGGALGRRAEKLSYMLKSSENDFLHRAFEFSPLERVKGILNQSFTYTDDKNMPNALKTALRASEGNSPLKRLLYMEYHGFLPDHNLTYTDKAAMVEGVEVRVPLIDKDLVALGAQLPTAQLIKGRETKYLLKKSLENVLPHSVLYRSKAGFGAPIRQWLVHDKREMLEDILFSQSAKERGIMNEVGVRTLIQNTQNGKVDGAYTLLSLLMMELWCQRFSDA